MPVALSLLNPDFRDENNSWPLAEIHTKRHEWLPNIAINQSLWPDMSYMCIHDNHIPTTCKKSGAIKMAVCIKGACEMTVMGTDDASKTKQSKRQVSKEKWQ